MNWQRIDACITLSAPGAPIGLGSTGNPVLRGAGLDAWCSAPSLPVLNDGGCRLASSPWLADRDAALSGGGSRSVETCKQ
jgi:hypothetical protein